MIYMESDSYDPYFNLAFEEYVLTHYMDGDYLILWQNDNTIVVGLNQNTEAEINRDFVEEHKIKVVRRMYMTGDQDGPPRKVGITVGDNVGALTAFGAIGAALYYRERTGIGQQIDVSLVKTLMWMSNKIDDLVLNGHMQHRNGNHHLTLCPYGLFSGNNGDAIVIATISQRLWEKLCNVIERPDLIDDPKFVTNEMRCRNQQELIGIIEGWIKSFGDIREAESKLMNAGIPCSKVYDHKDLCENEHYREAGWIVDMPLSDDVKSIRTKKSVGNPFQFSECEAHYGKAPVLGQNNLEILSSLGYSDDKAEELEDKWDRKARKK